MLYSVPFNRKSMIRRSDNIKAHEHVQPDIESIINSKESLDVILAKVKEFLKTKLTSDSSPRSLDKALDGTSLYFELLSIAV